MNWVIAKYRDLSVSRLRLRQIIDLLTTDKSRYFAQPHPIIAKYLYWRYPEHSNIKQTIRYKSCDVVSKKIKVEANYTEKKKNIDKLFSLALGMIFFLARHNFDDLFSQFRIILLCLSLPFSKKSHLVITQIDFLAEHVTF